ncbi:hypothetical protein COR50_09520 [Chitinophaga caeni]|uniref:Uncharacterized protein n=1 Tax=Chitinophaga caeni TaxID=2029983 RepID=A0A291QTT9_9BACT|nr:hypothetical protein [Chitinophaga caeni]ATL47388.1 hypothetical protein COR50_09520 [Chitinophaga caeni]
MKLGVIIKVILLALPIFVLIYVFLFRDHFSPGNSIGGGSYDLMKMYTSLGASVYLFLYHILLLITKGKEHKYLFIAAFLTLVITVILTIKSF